MIRTEHYQGARRRAGRLFSVAAALVVFSVDASGVTRKRADLDVDKSEVKSELASKKGKADDQPKVTRSSVFVIEVERAIINAVKRTVPVLKKNAKRMPKRSSGRLNLLERAINLNFELAVFLRNDEERGYDRKYQSWDNNGRTGREPQLNTRNSKKQWTIVINEARDILKEFPRGKNADRIIFYQAMALQQLGKEKDSARIFSELIQRFPNSPIASDAYAQLGDYFFDRNDFGNAANNYKKVTKYTQSKRYLWSIFKLAWCSFNTGRYKAALKYWQTVVSKARGKKGLDGALQLKEQALRDMVYAFSELKMVEPAIAYYRKNGGNEFIGPLLNLLSQTFAGNGQFGAAIKTLKRFQQIEPNDPAGPETQKEIIALLYALNQLPAVWKELKRYGGLYGPKSRWASVNGKKNGRLVKETQILIRDQLLTYSKLTHKEAIKESSPGLHKQARVGYLLFIDIYPSVKEVPEIRYNLADIEYYLKNYRKAGSYYLAITKLGKQKAVIYHPQKKAENIHKQSAKYMIDAYAKDFEAEFKVLQKRKPDFKGKQKKLSVRASNYINACSTYEKFYPEDKPVIKKCDKDVTRVFYASNNKAKAERYLFIMAKKYAGTKEGETSARQLISMNSGDDQRVLAVASRLLKYPAYRKGKLGAELKSLETNIELANIEKIKEPLKKARQYEAKAKKYPGNKKVATLWYNAGVSYALAGRSEAALRSYITVIKKHPKFENAKKSILEVAGIYERRLQFGESVKYYQLLIKKSKDKKEIAGGLAKVCELSLAENPSRAENLCLTFARRYKDAGKVIVERLINAAYREKRYSKMASLINGEYLKKFDVNNNDKIAANYKIYKGANGRGGAASSAAKKIAGYYARGGAQGEALRYATEIQFRAVDGEIERFSKLKLSGGSVDRLAASIDKKAGAITGLQKKYERVFATKDPFWGIAALYRLGSAYEDFASDLESPPSVQGAKKEDVAAQLAPKAKEIRKEALKYYRIAADTVSKYRVFNEWTSKIYDASERVTNSDRRFYEYFEAPDYAGSLVNQSIVSKLR